ncbi:amidohydrolase [Bacteroides pyogenes]|uniref:amidohydrolase n=1 Tax=Bacteroides pyogenes TaxID=310300 RepID=UPI0003DBDFB8|nr:amidohydrolase [Bacteroides pyogenes]MBB3896047.1 putative amidohydrolase [Bacteroides pyogenes]GAE22107.1 possible hydrolase [Bacteroides pyogenes JCM 10003]SUV34292.1 amidohydrolase [Bacteroides pyogenes]
MKISLIQTDIVWEDKQGNLRSLHEKLQSLRGTTEIVVLPEMFSTGFSMQTRLLAEPAAGETIRTLREWAALYDTAICGSYMAEDKGAYYNRAFFLTPEGSEFYCDKRHLFRMGEEPAHFSSGNSRLIFPYRGWNIRLLVCYDLRFPVWSRNVNNAYDLLIYVANWPLPRRTAWDTLLRARAIENQCYVCGVNRTGADANGLEHDGGSVILSATGETIVSLPDGKEGIATGEIGLPALRRFREKFPAWKDADVFRL